MNALVAGSRGIATSPKGRVVGIDAWEPFWLDAESRCLYAALHRPATGGGPLGVVFVPPLLHEQPRSRHFLTEVAGRFAALGLPCLRFDFLGTGDSSGTGMQLDFASMRCDLDLAIAALRSRAGVERVALLAWRGAALPVFSWLHYGQHADLVVLWEPITDGERLLADLERKDADERDCRPPVRPGLKRTAGADDGQLMGFAVSPRLRRDFAETRLEPQLDHVPIWAVVRHEASPLPIQGARVLSLPASSPTFNGGASMEATFFLSPPLERVVDELGRALLEKKFR